MIPLRFIIIDNDPVNNLLCRLAIKDAVVDADILDFTNPLKAFEYISAYSESNNGMNILLLDINMHSWSGWDFADPSVKPLIDKNYETVHLTVYESPNKKALENPGALQLLTKHGGADQGLPYWFVFDDNRNLLADSQYKPGENTGCPASEEEVTHWINVLKKTTSLKEQELEVIRKRFRKNEM